MVTMPPSGVATITNVAVLVTIPRSVIPPEVTIGLSLVSVVVVAAAMFGMIRRNRLDRRSTKHAVPTADDPRRQPDARTSPASL
jgi:chromate transport protein ChrA